MHEHVKEKLLSVLKQPQYEGVVPNMYLDRLGLVTIGIGFLIDGSKSNPSDPVKPALGLPFVYKDDSALPSKDRESVIRAEWTKVKSLQHLKGKSAMFGPYTKLKLGLDQMHKLYDDKIKGFVAEIHTVPAFSGFDRWPADAQLGLLSMVYAGGTGLLKRSYPNFVAACANENFLGAANACEFETTDRPFRNQFDREVFQNAAFVVHDKSFDRSKLIYPLVMYACLWLSEKEVEEVYRKYPKLRADYKLVYVKEKGKFFKDLYKQFPELQPKGW